VTDLKELSIAAQDNILSVMKMSQTVVLEAVRNMTDAVGRFAPDMAMPALPALDKLPSPAEGLTMSFGFAEKLLDNQKEFVQSILSTVVPEAPKPSPKAAKG
jgi:hypothetical protein